MKVKRGNLKPVYGSTREDRVQARLRPDYAPIDQRTQADRLAFAGRFAPLLQFYDESNKPAGDWSAFFEFDLAFLLASIVTTDFQREQFQSWTMYNAVRRGDGRTREVLNTIARMVHRINDWYEMSQAIERHNFKENSLKQSLQSIIENDLRPQFGASFLKMMESMGPAPGEESWPAYWQKQLQGLNPIWMETSNDDVDVTEGVNKATDRMFSSLYALHSANARLLTLAGQYLEETLQSDTSHAPQTALYIAFVRLLDLFRDKINGITGRHLDFYYRDVLRLKERPASPDQAHVCFALAPQLPRFLVPAKTRLAAGKDASGNIIEYATDTDLFINRARVASLRALYLSHDRPAASTHGEHRVVSVVALPQADSADGISQPLPDPSAGWPTFGVDETAGGSASASSLNAELGFIVASPVLLMQEGERNVTVSITFSGENSLDHAIGEYQNLADHLLEASPPTDLLLADAFNVFLSGQKEWTLVPDPSFHRHPVVGTAMEIEFTLDPAAPPVVANPALAPDPQRAQWPMLKLVLNPAARIFAYSFFKELKIETIEIRVGASGLEKLQVCNEFGPLNASQPFPFFGPIPTLGSYLLVAHPELAIKQINHVTLTIAWFNLPIAPENFTSLYSAYGLGITDDSFRLRWSIFAAGKWIAPAANDLFAMFARDYDRSAGLLPVTTLGLEIPAIPLPANVSPQPSPPIMTDSQAPRGTLRLELAAPAAGFGHAAFPRIMAEVATSNARIGRHGEPKPLPNLPLSPAAKSLVMDYQAADKLNLSRPLPENQSAAFYSIFPFGYTPHDGRATSMFPSWKEQGHLYLGLADIGPQQTFTLLFEIRDAGFSPIPAIRHHHDEKEKPLLWRYLSHNEWKEIPKALLLSDTTMGLTQSGIVQITLPEDITCKNSTMPAGLYWIEAALKKVASVYWCHVVSINTQAVTATRICNPKSDQVAAVLPAKSITQLSEKRPQIKAILQPFATSGGRAAENRDEFYVRVSERLRHKDRAIQTFDYERLVLDAFPEVGQVKCIGHNNSRYFTAVPAVPPGMLFIVAAPRLEDSAGPEPRLPQSTLTKIEKFLRGPTDTEVKEKAAGMRHCSAFVEDIHVINPVYETLKIFTRVAFNTEGDSAYYFDDLNAAINEYLHPWRKGLGKPLYIGSGQVQGYELAKFIQQKSYIKELESLFMLHTYQTESGYVSRWRSIDQRVWASAPWAVLAPAANHGIVDVAAEKQAKKIETGIGSLAVRADFVIGPPRPKKSKEDVPEQRYFLVVPRTAIHGTSRQ